jgi:hypothetical protein
MRAGNRFSASEIVKRELAAIAGVLRLERDAA